MEGREGKEGKGREGRDGKGVPECPNPELASLSATLAVKLGFVYAVYSNWV